MDNDSLRMTHTISYEVMDCRNHIVCETVKTYPCYDSCLDIFYKILNESKHARIDLVVRDGLGTPMFRTPLLDMEYVEKSNAGPYYSDPFGHFGNPTVYNSDYKDSQNAGYEFYTKPTKQWG